MSEVETAAPVETTTGPARGPSFLSRYVLPPTGVPARGSTLLRNLIVTVVVVAVLMFITGRLGDFWDSEVAVIAADLCAIAGLTVLTGLNGQISLGHIALMATGAYTVAFIITAFSNHNEFAQWTLPIALLAAIVVTSVLGLIIGVAAARLRGPYLAGLTLAVAVAVPGVTSGYSHVFGGDQGIDFAVNGPPAGLGEAFSNEEWQAWFSIIAAALVMFVLANLVRSGFGRQMRAVRDDEVSAQLAGVHVARTQVITFVLSAACAGLGGGVYAAISDSATPGAFSLTQSLYLLLAIVLGGLGSLFGAVWGAIAIVLLPYAAAQIMSNEPLKLQGNVPMAILGALLMVIAIALPGGLQGLLRRVGHLLWHRRAGTGSVAPPAPEVPISTPSTTS